MVGCQSGRTASDPLVYHPTAPQASVSASSELDARLAFLENRLKDRPQAFMEQAELAGLYLQKGKLHLQAEPLARARTWAETSMKSYPNNGARIVLADLLQMEHKFADSLSILGRVLREEPGQQQARTLAVRALLAQGKPRQAQEVLEPVAQQPSFAYRFLLGQVSEAMGDKDRAAELYREALGREPEISSPSESARLRAVWARMEQARGNLDLAEHLLQTAKAIPVSVPLVDMQLARLAEARQDWKGAAAILRDGFALYQDPTFLMELAAVLQAEGQKDEAAQNYRAAVDLIRSRPFGHERDVAKALLALDPQANKAEILKMMGRELERRRDPATMEVWQAVSKQLGPLPEPAPFPQNNPIADAAKAPARPALPLSQRIVPTHPGRQPVPLVIPRAGQRQASGPEADRPPAGPKR
jgi:tetratricopeptide (TPR) repeat protein